MTSNIDALFLTVLKIYPETMPICFNVIKIGRTITEINFLDWNFILLISINCLPLYMPFKQNVFTKLNCDACNISLYKTRTDITKTKIVCFVIRYQLFLSCKTIAIAERNHAVLSDIFKRQRSATTKSKTTKVLVARMLHVPIRNQQG